MGSGCKSSVDGLAGVLVFHVALSPFTIQRGIAGAIGFFPPAGANGREDLLGSEPDTRLEWRTSDSVYSIKKWKSQSTN